MNHEYRAFLLNPYSMRNLVVESLVVGTHSLSKNVYHARIYTTVRLPDALITNKAFASTSMARQKIKKSDLKNIRIWSDAYLFPNELLGLRDVSAFEDAWRTLGQPTRLLREIRFLSQHPVR